MNDNSVFDSPGTITRGEYVLSLIAVIVVGILANALCINASVNIGAKISKMSAAPKITDNSQFVYAVETQYTGGVFGTGVAKMAPVTDPRIIGEYGRIVDYVEEYTRHTRQVCVDRDSDGKCTAYEDEVYYTWDYVRKNDNFSPVFNFMGKDFNTNQFDIQILYDLPIEGNVSQQYASDVYFGYLYDDGYLFNSVGDTRHYFKATPLEFSGTTFINSIGAEYLNVDGRPCGCYISSQSPDDIIKSYKLSANFVRYVLPSIVVILTLILLAYFAEEN